MSLHGNHGPHGPHHAKVTDDRSAKASKDAAGEVAKTNKDAGQEAAVRGLLHAFFPGLGDPFRVPNGKNGPTDFEGRKLNELIDLVEHADPGHLTRAGQALWDARDAISDAAEELRGHVANVDWDGEGGRSFGKWAGELVSNAHKLSDYASKAGTQLHVAGSGLSSVKGSMPPPDTRAHKKTVEEIPEHKRVEGNPEYDEAVKVEGHRQEAINQVNRLASFYTVAATSMPKDPPTFTPMKDPGIPQPVGGWKDTGGTGRTNTGTLEREGGVPDSSAHGHAVAHGGDRPDLKAHGTISDLPHQNVSTEIDSAPPPLTQAPPTVTDPGPISPSHGQTNPVNPFTTGPGPLNTSQNGTPPKAFGKTPGPMGREAISGNRNVNPTARGTTNNPMGRGLTSQARATGRGGTTGRMPMGRAVSGGTPRAAGPAKSSQAGAVRKGGVVGGRPNSQTPGATSRVPRGTVIGGQQQNGGRTSGTGGKLGQRGVIGAQKPASPKTPSVRPAPGAPEGVVGAPTERTTGPKGERAGFTQGGSGLVRGNGEQNHAADRHHPERATERPQHQDVNGAEHTTQHETPHAPPATE
ncbi:hypothetical protein [Streptomyces odontomachi]|uniref:hypothetical protein n=1 Tax=Streptomyces odontomachi TaxID=2944940 RepID=UPI00210EF772|nr:hypothetical protein [Streptomyces sp. ODS25]